MARAEEPVNADDGHQLRLAVVGLRSGRLRYVTERGALLERDGQPHPQYLPPPGTPGLAEFFEALSPEFRSS